jgi:hypothetical protein
MGFCITLQKAIEKEREYNNQTKKKRTVELFQGHEREWTQPVTTTTE